MINLVQDELTGAWVSDCGLVFREIPTFLRGPKRSRIAYSYNGRKEDVSRLVARAWIKNPENRPLVCHKDDNPSNNHVDNLYWGTVWENMQDIKLAKLLEARKKGEYVSTYKTVWEMHKEGRAGNRIAEILGVTEGRISQMISEMRKYRELKE